MKNVLIVGGSSGIGRAIAIYLVKQGIKNIEIIDKKIADNSGLDAETICLLNKYTKHTLLNLNNEEFEIFDRYDSIDTLIITAGFGRVALFEDLLDYEINNLIKCNELAPIRIIKKFFNRIKSNQDFNCAVMVSIAGRLVSPYFSVYGATKAALSMFIESINCELAASGYKNRILDCSPGNIAGTAFNNHNNDYSKTIELAENIVNNMLKKETLFIPDYDEIYSSVIERYKRNPLEYGLHSFNYKKESGRIITRPQSTIGYLSGTFDLFHIGHLNILKNAKNYCDYLIVGIHENGSWKGKETFIPLKERKEIVAACKYVDRVVDSCPEDSDAWILWNFDVLIVGSDYKNSDRFKKYEEFFKDKNVEIVYLPYTKTTSSTQLRMRLTNSGKDI